MDKIRGPTTISQVRTLEKGRPSRANRVDGRRRTESLTTDDGVLKGTVMGGDRRMLALFTGRADEGSHVREAIVRADQAPHISIERPLHESEAPLT